MNSTIVALDHITVPPYVSRPLSKVADSRDMESVRAVGIQQPLILVQEGDRLLLADGLRRLRIARSLGLGKVPALIYPLPRGEDASAYVSELRFALDFHRQALLPSQKCGLIEQLKERYGMTNKQVAASLGIDPDSVTNYMAVRNYIAPVVEALDAGRLTQQHARTFDGMTEEGQQYVWKRHSRDLCEGTGADWHKELRAAYGPEKYPQFYRNPDLTKKRLAQKQGKRNGTARPTITHAEKRRLSASLEMKDLELREGAAEEKRLKAEISAAIAPLAAIMRSERLLALVPAEMREEIERFQEIF